MTLKAAKLLHLTLVTAEVPKAYMVATSEEYNDVSANVIFKTDR